MTRPVLAACRRWWKRGAHPLLLPLLIGSGLLLLPFFWLGGNASLGGDDTRLYFVDPWQWLWEFALPAFGSLSGFGTYSQQQNYIPFSALLGVVELAFPSLNLEALAFGILLASGFIGVYATSLLLMPRRIGNLGPAVAALAGLTFTLAPIVATTFWFAPLSGLIGVYGAPVLVALSVAYLRSARSTLLLLLAVLNAVYAAGFGALPVAIPFAFGAAVVAGMTLLLLRRPWWLLRRGVLLGCVLLGANVFWMLPLGVSVLTPGSAGNTALAASKGVGLTIRGLSHGQSMLDTLLLLPSGEFMRTFESPLYPLWGWFEPLVLPSLLLLIVIGGALVLARSGGRGLSGRLMAFGAAALVLAYLQTVNVTSVGIDGFIALVSAVPGFGMFRNFYSKFAGGYALFYSVTLALACAAILARLPLRRGWAAYGVLMGLTLLRSGPLLLGLTLFLPMTGPGTPGPAYTQVGRFPPSYMQAMAYLSRVDHAGRVLELPLSANYWSETPLSGVDVMYVGSSPVRVLSHTESFNSAESFAVAGMPELRGRLETAIAARDDATIGAILRMAGIRYLFYTDGLPAAVRERWLHKPAFPSDAGQMAGLAQALGATKVASFADGGTTKDVFAISADGTLPRLFVTQNVDLVSSPDDLITRAAMAQQAGLPRSASDATNAFPVSSLAAPLPARDVVLAGMPDPAAIRTLEHGVAWRYTLRLQVNRPSLLVLLEPYGSGWQASFAGSAETGVRQPASIRVDGYATGWVLPAGNYTAEITYGPQRFTWLAGAVSLLTIALTALGVLIQARLGWGRCRPAGGSNGKR